MPQADRRPGRFPAVRLSHLEADELPNSGDPQGIGSQRRARGTPTRRQVTYVPYDPSFEMPAEGGPNERLTGDSIPGESRPAEYSWPCFKPAQSSLFEPRLVRAPISAARHERTDLWRSISIKRLPQRKHQSLARDPWSCSSLRCALNTASRHSVCCLICRQE